MSVIDKSLYFGQQNLFFVKADETGDTYNYYGFMNRRGLILFIRTDKDATEAKYHVSKGEFDTLWEAKDETETEYVYPSDLKDLPI